MKDEGNETVTNCHALKMLAPDGKMRLTDVADTEQLFRLIQSITSKKAEPFKQWMAQVATPSSRPPKPQTTCRLQRMWRHCRKETSYNYSLNPSTEVT